MKNSVQIVAIGIILMGLVGCGQTPSGISGTITGGENKIVELHAIKGAHSTKIFETTANASGYFLIEPSYGLPLDYYSITIQGSRDRVLLITDSTEKPVLTADASDFERTAVVTGSPNTQRLHEFQKNMRDISDQMETLSKKDRDGIIRIDADADYVRLQREARNNVMQVLDGNPKSPVVLAAITHLNIEQELDQYTRVKNNLRDVMPNSAYYQLVSSQIDNARARKDAAAGQSQRTPGAPGMLSPGDEAPEIAQANPKGKVMKLSDLRGKVVLIDFWASWCGPCRAENPNVVAAYGKYKSKGFEVFSVSLDNSADRWVAAIEQDKLTWEYHVSDLKGWQNAAAQMYKVTSIPRTFLIDKQGKVIEANLRGHALEAKLKEVLGA